MKKGDIIVAFTCIAIGSVFLILSQEFPKEISNSPGPGFYPALLSYLLIVLGVILFIQSLASKKRQEIVITLKSKQAIFSYKITGISILYVIFLPILGFILTTLLFIAVTSYLMGIKNWKIIMILPIIITTLTVIIFEVVFHIPLPGQSIF